MFRRKPGKPDRRLAAIDRRKYPASGPVFTEIRNGMEANVFVRRKGAIVINQRVSAASRRSIKERRRHSGRRKKTFDLFTDVAGRSFFTVPDEKTVAKIQRNDLKRQEGNRFPDSMKRPFPEAEIGRKTGKKKWNAGNLRSEIRRAEDK
ncbi:MAG TPA: hypothetical protein VFF09_03205 [archaeon]|nr:hypothetical protein [archaeon]